MMSRTGSASAHAIATALRQIDGWVTPNGVKGAGAVVWHRGEQVAERYAGEAQAGIPVDASTLFALASVTKPITAAVMMCLVEDGIVALDEPVDRFLPEFIDATDAGAFAKFRQIVTLRHLLCHTSGLPEDLTSRQVRLADKPSLDDLIDAMVRLPLLSAPGAALRYSNAGYGMLARITERLTGRSFWDFAAERVLEPLALHSIVARPGPALAERLVHVHDTARPGTEVESYNSPYWRNLGLPWGGLYGTPADLARFAGSFLPPGPRLLSAASVQAMTADQVGGVPGGVGSLKLRWNRGFWGLGWEVKGDKVRHWTGELTSPRTFCHFGAAGTLLWADPDNDLVLAVFANRMTLHLWPFRPARWARLSNALVAAVS
jgi:CubicO group peptidase (beta-lactamase class C family)